MSMAAPRCLSNKETPASRIRIHDAGVFIDYAGNQNESDGLKLEPVRAALPCLMLPATTLVAIPTIHRTTLRGFERNFGRLATFGADRRVKLARTSATAPVSVRSTHSSSATTATRHTRGFSFCPAIRTPLGLVGEPALGIPLLVLRRMEELRTTIRTSNVSVSIRHQWGLSYRARPAKLLWGIPLAERPDVRVDAPDEDRRSTLSPRI